MPEFAFEGTENTRVPDMMSWGRLYQMLGRKCEKVQKPWVEVPEFEHACA